MVARAAWSSTVCSERKQSTLANRELSNTNFTFIILQPWILKRKPYFQTRSWPWIYNSSKVLSNLENTLSLLKCESLVTVIQNSVLVRIYRAPFTTVSTKLHLSSLCSWLNRGECGHVMYEPGWVWRVSGDDECECRPTSFQYIDGEVMVHIHDRLTIHWQHLITDLQII